MATRMGRFESQSCGFIMSNREKLFLSLSRREVQDAGRSCVSIRERLIPSPGILHGPRRPERLPGPRDKPRGTDISCRAIHPGRNPDSRPRSRCSAARSTCSDQDIGSGNRDEQWTTRRRRICSRLASPGIRPRSFTTISLRLIRVRDSPPFHCANCAYLAVNRISCCRYPRETWS
jgi:hypothetical protein